MNKKLIVLITYLTVFGSCGGNGDKDVTPPSCPAGYHKDATGNCVKDDTSPGGKDSAYMILLSDSVFAASLHHPILIDSVVTNIVDKSWQWDLLRGIKQTTTPAITGLYYWIDDSNHVTLKEDVFDPDSLYATLNWKPPYNGKYYIRFGAEGVQAGTVQLNPEIFLSKNGSKVVGPGCAGSKVTFK